MDITKYAGYFHDGNLIDIKHKNNYIEIFLESSQIDSIELDNKKILSESFTLKGKLCLAGVKSLKVGNKLYRKVLDKTYDDGEILDLEIYPNRVLLLIEWKSFQPKQRINDVSKIEIEAEKVWWENIPDLADPLSQ